MVPSLLQSNQTKGGISDRIYRDGRACYSLLTVLFRLIFLCLVLLGIGSLAARFRAPAINHVCR